MERPGKNKCVRFFESTTGSICLSFFILFFFSPFSSLSQGNLQITPKRIVFDGSRKSQVVSVANIGNDTIKYTASFVQVRMKEDGAFEQITEPDSGQNFASDHLRYYPKEFTLAPRESQSIKIELRRNIKLEPGEYRSHILFRAASELEEKPVEPATAEKKPIPANLMIKLVPVFGITIPVIIQVGAPTTKVSITDLSFKMENDTIPHLKINFQREGNMSVYGNIKVFYSTANGKIKQVGLANGFGIYVPNKTRFFNVNLEKVPGVNYKNGKLHVLYETQNQRDPVTIAERELTI